MARRASRMWASDAESAEEARTSAFTARRKCVTSSGRSSMSSRMRWTSGWCLAMAWPRCSSSVVLPALGGETMRPRWPRPMGAIRSMTRRLVSACSPASRKASCGLTETRSWKCGSARYSSGVSPLAFWTSTSVRRPPPPSRARPSISVPSRKRVVPGDLRPGPRRRRETVGSSGRPASRTRRRPPSDPRRPRPRWSGLSSGSGLVAGPSALAAPADAAVGVRWAGRVDGGVDGAAGAAGRASSGGPPSAERSSSPPARTIARRRAAQGRVTAFRRGASGRRVTT